MSKINISPRISTLPLSAVRKLVPYANETKKKGVLIYHLNIGDPDIKTPEAMLKVLKQWQINPIGYAPGIGEPIFLDALLTYYHRLGQIFVKKEDLIATIGGSEAVAMALFAVTSPGDEVLVFEPFYSGYLPPAHLFGVKLVAVPTRIQDGFHLPPKKTIESKITTKTKAILFCTPGNPTGTVYTRQEMKMLVALAKKRGLFLISDEVYREFIFVNRSHVSLLEFMTQIPDQAILVDSLSKRYSLCGARLGVLLSLNKAVIKGVSIMAQGRLSGGLIDQHLAAKLIDVPHSYISAIQKEYRKRRDFLYEGLLSIPGVTMTKPEGAFYCMVSLPVKNAEQFCIWLLTHFRDNNETVMLAPGAGFYITPGQGKNEVRIAYVLKISQLKRCIQIIAQALSAYNTQVM